jgi:hypothetical protein
MSEFALESTALENAPPITPDPTLRAPAGGHSSPPRLRFPRRSPPGSANCARVNY